MHGDIARRSGAHNAACGMPRKISQRANKILAASSFAYVCLARRRNNVVSARHTCRWTPSDPVLGKDVTEIGKSVCVVKRKPEAAGCAQRAVKSCPKRNSPRTFGNVHASNPTDDKNATGVMSTVHAFWHAAEQPSERYRVSSRYGNEPAIQQCYVQFGKPSQHGLPRGHKNHEMTSPKTRGR